MRRPTAPLIAALALIACADTDEPDPTPVRDGGNDMVDPVVAQAGEPLEIEQGEWVPASIDGRTGIGFVPAGEGSEPVFAIACDERDGILLERRGVVDVAERQMMQLRFGGVARSYAAVQPDLEPPVLRAKIPFNDDALAELAVLDGPIGIGFGVHPPLMMPAPPEIGDLVAACERR